MKISSPSHEHTYILRLRAKNGFSLLGRSERKGCANDRLLRGGAFSSAGYDARKT